MKLSLQACFWRTLMRNTIKHQWLPLAESRRRAKRTARVMNFVPREMEVEKIDITGTPAAWIRPAHAATRPVILHLHGGGYATGGLDTYQMMMVSMAQTTGLNILLPEYRLAPEHPFPAALEDAQKTYRWLLEQGHRPAGIILTGDSAGGGLAVATVLALRDAGTPLPAAVVCISPWTDLTFTGRSHITQARSEAMLQAAALRQWGTYYAGTEDPHNPLISPIYADLRGLPPMLIQVGSEEILLDDAHMLAEKARADGVNVELKVWDGLWHVWHALGSLIPESRMANEEIKRFIQVVETGSGTRVVRSAQGKA
jgi:acetyl esterase/lipase